jgi:hypothetical protein
VLDGIQVAQVLPPAATCQAFRITHHACRLACAATACSDPQETRTGNGYVLGKDAHP